MWFLALMVIGAVIIVPVLALSQAAQALRESRELAARLRALEDRLAGGALASPPPDLSVVPHEPSAPLDLPPPVPIASAPAPPPHAAAPPRTLESLEEQIGGVWLQNVASVLILLGVFFLIVWGYTTGRFGPEVLVGAGVALGFALVWRGDRVARRIPRFGHALVGLGLGAAYVSLYLGRFTLHVLDERVGFVLLTSLALVTVALGLRYQAPSVGALGVIGAFVPPLIAAFAPLRGFSMAPDSMLLYIAFVNAVVVALAMRSGWDMLSLLALLLTTVTWTSNFYEKTWGWPIQIGLATMYTMLGLIPLLRLPDTERRDSPILLLTVAAAPVLLLITSWPFLAAAHRTFAAMLLLALAAIYLGAAAWTDTRRAERDLWRPLTGASTVFLTAALQRWVGSEWTPLAWCVEGTLLATLGLEPRAGWLRFCGYVVAGLGGFGVFLRMIEAKPASPDLLPVLNPESVRMLGSLAVLAVLAWSLARRRERLSSVDRAMPEVITACVNLLLVGFSVREADHAARALVGGGGRWARPPALGTTVYGNIRTLSAGLTSAAWALHAAVLFTLGWAGRSAFLRWAGLSLFGLTVIKFLVLDLATVDAFWRFLVAIGVGVMLLAVSYLYQRRRRALEP